MSKTAAIFAASIIATVLLTAIAMTIIQPSEDEEQFEAVSAAVNGILIKPQGVAVNGSDNIFVVDTGNSIVQVFNADGAFNFTFATADEAESAASLFRPCCIEINSTNFIHIADTFTGVIKVYDKGGDYKKTIGAPGDGTGQLYRPSGVTSNATHIFVADTFNNRIVIFDQSGTQKDTIP